MRDENKGLALDLSSSIQYEDNILALVLSTCFELKSMNMSHFIIVMCRSEKQHQ